MLRAAALTFDAGILTIVLAYFALEGIGRNVAFELFLAAVGLASLVILVTAIRGAPKA